MSETEEQACQMIAQLLKSHGLAVTEYRGWLVVGGALPSLRCQLGDPQVFEQVVSVEAHVELALQDGRILCECFAGVGSGEREAVGNAIENFARSSLHVFLAAFWGAVDPGQVTVEKWHIGGADWQVIIGNYTMRGESVEIPDGAFSAIEGLLKTHVRTGDLHWVRTFYCNLGTGATVAEAVLDNEEWAEAKETLGRLAWPRRSSYYSIRHFLVMQRAASQGAGLPPP